MRQNILWIILIVFLLVPSISYADDVICATYFTGVGCPHCAEVDPILLPNLTEEYNLIVIEYEIYKQNENAPLIYQYNNVYDSGLGIPLLILGKEDSLVGDKPILSNIELRLNNMDSNDCPLSLESVSFDELDLVEIAGKPKLWANNRILISDGSKIDNSVKALLLTQDIPATMSELDYSTINPEPVLLSGSKINFEHAVDIDGWVFQWNGPGVENRIATNQSSVTNNSSGTDSDLSMYKILSLAAVDAVNPCAIAVLTLMLVAIMTYNPGKKHKILLAGLAFTSSVFIIYMFYGLILIKFFQIANYFASFRLVLYKILGAFAIILGLLNIKDFFFYTPGGLATEMPLSWRPKLKKMMARITSPSGAFVIGAFVTIFLLPCTIGPYVLASGILSIMSLVKTIPWLLLYNAIFVLPMLVITLFVYLGISRVEDIGGWKDRNIKYLHLISGIIMFLLGLAMLFTWF